MATEAVRPFLAGQRHDVLLQLVAGRNELIQQNIVVVARGIDPHVPKTARVARPTASSASSIMGTSLRTFRFAAPIRARRSNIRRERKEGKEQKDSKEGKEGKDSKDSKEGA
jgi:hypothetical protein